MTDSNPIAPVGDLAHTAVDTAEDVTGAGAKMIAVSAIATLQLARNLVDAAEGLAEMGIDFGAETVDSLLAKLQEYVQKTAAG